jgi:hypothetical protein
MFIDNSQENEDQDFGSFSSYSLIQDQDDKNSSVSKDNSPSDKDMPLDEEKKHEIKCDNINPNQNDEDKYSKEVKSQEFQEKKALLCSTASNSDKKGKNKIEKKIIFTMEKAYPEFWRLDSCIKHWKTRIGQYGKELGNELMEDLPEEFKTKIHKPNSLSFTANDKEEDNYNFLSYNLEKVYTTGKERKDGKYQKQNYKTITNIYNYCDKFENDHHLPENFKKVYDFFKKTSYEDLIKKFYDSEKFINFKKDYMTKYYDEGFMQQEGFSLLKDYGLIRQLKTLKKKRKRNKSKEGSF